MEEWPYFSQVFDAVPPCFIESYGGLNNLQDTCEHSSVRKLQPKGMKELHKINNKPVNKVVIEEFEEEPLAFLMEILKPNLGQPRKATRSILQL